MVVNTTMDCLLSPTTRNTSPSLHEREVGVGWEFHP